MADVDRPHYMLFADIYYLARFVTSSGDSLYVCRYPIICSKRWGHS